MAASRCLLLLLPWLVVAPHSPPGCKIRITSAGLELGKGLQERHVGPHFWVCAGGGSQWGGSR